MRDQEHDHCHSSISPAATFTRSTSLTEYENVARFRPTQWWTSLTLKLCVKWQSSANNPCKIDVRSLFNKFFFHCSDFNKSYTSPHPIMVWDGSRKLFALVCDVSVLNKRKVGESIHVNAVCYGSEAEDVVHNGLFFPEISMLKRVDVTIDFCKVLVLI